MSFNKTQEAFEELAQVIKEVINETLDRDSKENNLIEGSTIKRRCAFCGGPKVDIPIPRGRKTLLVCDACYRGAKALIESDKRESITT
jgi:hypothetical protein